MSLSKDISISTSQIGYNEDLMAYIFLQLPVKSVLKCKCVCKQWQSIASNPQLCHRHASLSGPNPNPSGLIFKRSINNNFDFKFCSLTDNYRNKNKTTFTIASFDYLNHPGSGNLSLLSSCNGLFLFQSSKSPDLGEFHVCNPTTKKSFGLTLPDYLARLARVDANVAFDPCVSPHYKVVFLWRGLEDRLCISIYSSETKSYGEVSAPVGLNAVRVLQSSGIFCNGKIHWLVEGEQTLFYFDVEEGYLNEFQMPPSSPLWQTIHIFGAARGRLHLVLRSHSLEDTFVYEMKEDYSGWFLKNQLGFRSENLLLCYLWKEQDEGSMLLQLDDSGMLEAYNLNEKITKKVCDPLFNNGDIYSKFNLVYQNYQWCPLAYQWIETLSCNYRISTYNLKEKTTKKFMFEIF